MPKQKKTCPKQDSLSYLRESGRCYLQHTDYMEFVKNLEQMIIELMEESQNIDIKHVNYLKNNNVVKEELQIFTPGSQVGRILDPRPLFARHLAGTPLEQLAREVVDICLTDEPKAIIEVWKIIREFEKIRHRIFVRVINLEANQTFLSLCPYVRVLDLAVTFRIEVSNTDEGLLSMAVDHTMFNQWGIDKMTLYNEAILNTKRRFPGDIIPIHCMVDQGFAECLNDVRTSDEKEEMEEAMMQWQIFKEEVADELETDYMYAITNSKKINGASAVFYPGFVREFAARIQSDLYLLPSSIHEMMIVPVKHWDEPAQLKVIVDEANEAVVSAEERLGSHVYKYTYDTDEMTIVA